MNNVGGSGARTFDEMDVDDLEDVLGRNLIPALAVSRAALPSARAWRRRDRARRLDLGARGRRQPELQRRQGCRDQPGQGDGRDLAKDRIRVFSVAPGSTLFPGGSWERRVRDDPEGMAAFVERELPWGRFGTVDEVADVVDFLVSPRASWVVGTCVAVDGGQSRSF